VRAHDRLMREAVTANGGYVFKTMGDAFCLAFAISESATAAVLDVQRALWRDQRGLFELLPGSPHCARNRAALPRR
jgi:class 3 adenylate cyclase